MKALLSILSILVVSALFTGCQKTDAQHARELEAQKQIAIARMEAEARRQMEELHARKIQEQEGEQTKRQIASLFFGLLKLLGTVSILGVAVYGMHLSLTRFRERQKAAERMQERFRLTIGAIEKTLPLLPERVGMRYMAELIQATRDPQGIQGDVAKVMQKVDIIEMPAGGRHA